MSRLRRLRPHQWTQLSNEAIDHLPDPSSIGLLAYLLRLPEGADLPSMDYLAATMWPGRAGRRTLYTSMRDLVAGGYIVKIRYQAGGGQWVTDTYLFAERVTDDELAELASMFPAGSRIESREGIGRITTDHTVDHLEDLPAAKTRTPPPSGPGRRTSRSDRPASTGRSVTGRSVTDRSGVGRSTTSTSSGGTGSKKNHHQNARTDDATPPDPNPGGGESSPETPPAPPPPVARGPESPAAREVLDLISATLPLGTPDRAALAAQIDTAVAAGWEPAILGAHLLARPPAQPISAPAGWLTYRLTGTHRTTGVPVLPEGPTVCPCPPCRRHVRITEAEIRREAERLASTQADVRHQAAAETAAARHDTITEAIGTALHSRIIDTAVSATPMYQRARNSPALVRSLVDQVYADHDYDVPAIRAYAEALPPVTSTAPTATISALTVTESPVPTPTHADGTVRPSADELAAAIAARIGAA